MRWKTSVAAAFAVGAACVCGQSYAKPLGKSAHGKPAIKSVQSLAFGPEGTLLIGDGASNAVFAVATGEKPSTARFAGKIDDVGAKLAATLGAKADGIEILDLAVSPVSNTVFVAVRKQDDKVPVLLTVKADGSIGLFSLDSVEYARVALKTGAANSTVNDVAWADDKLVASVGTGGDFGSKMFVVQTPLNHEAEVDLHAVETFHVQHNKWETKSPMSTIMPFEEDGKTYVAGAFSCTPVVKYPIEELKPEANVVGTSVLELGSGNRPLDMFTYTKNGKEYVLSNTFRFHHARKPVGPSPYWTVRFDRDLLGEDEKVNKDALRRLAGDAPATPKVLVVESFHGVRQMDRLGDAEAVVLRETADNKLELAVLPLP